MGDRNLKLFKAILCLYLIMGLLVSFAACSESVGCAGDPTPWTTEYFTFFDTVTRVYSYAGDSQENFENRCDEVSAILEEYHRLFDIYHEYSGINNLRTLNLNAGKEPLTVDRKLIDFLLYAKEMHYKTNGEMNIMMGSVLSLWHDCRDRAGKDQNGARIPTEEELDDASAYTDMSFLEIDPENNTAFITNSKASIDVGALGKGYAAEKAADYLKSVGAEAYVLDVGGNLRIVGHKPDGSGWVTGIKDPSSIDSYALRLTLADVSCVTSGNYERFYTMDGKDYHHIIDKDTLMPAEYFSSVTVICEDSGLADALSTALFCMSYEQGLALARNIGDVEVFWIKSDGTQYMTDGLSDLIKESD